jgi:hypothetical protein
MMPMRRRNARLAMAGLLLMVLGAVFFLVMLSIAPQSTDPAELMRIVGTVSGAGVGIGVALVLGGLIGKRIA